MSYSFINTPYFLSNFQAILKEIDEDFTDDEIDDIILDVSFIFSLVKLILILQTDLDKSDTIDFDEWVKLMS